MIARDLLDAKKSDPFKLWQFRMEKDGTWKDILEDFKSIQEATGEKGFSSIMHKHAKDHGYDGAAKERELFRKYEALEDALQEGGDLRTEALLEFEKIVSRLSDRVSSKKENNWIASHAAMRRKALTGAKAVVLTIDDITDAPSQAAVNKLQYWANEPKEFFKGLQAAEKPAPPPASKKVQKDEAEKVKIDPTAKQCREMLEAFLGDGVSLEE
jgi:hypothetical protein